MCNKTDTIAGSPIPMVSRKYVPAPKKTQDGTWTKDSETETSSIYIISKMLLEQNAEDRITKGKPRKQWMDGVRKNMIKKDPVEEDADDREL